MKQAHGRLSQWSTDPAGYIEKAKERAQLALTDPSIKLTTLERSFYNVFQQQHRSTRTSYR